MAASFQLAVTPRRVLAARRKRRQRRRVRRRCKQTLDDHLPPRGDLERVLDGHPDSTASRQLLIGVLLELTKDDEAAAVGDVLRADPKRLPRLAADLLKQADDLAKKYPAAPSVPVNWLTRAINAAHKSTTDPTQKAVFEVVLKATADAKGDAERLAILRRFLTKLTSKTGE